MGKLPHRRIKQAEAEHDHTGCMWGFISLFDFRRGRYNCRLLPEKRFGNRVLCGAEHSPKTVRSSAESDYQFDDDGCDSTQPMIGAGKSSVKELMEQDMVVDDERNQNTDGVENKDSDFESQGHKKSSKPQRIKHKHFSMSSAAKLEEFAKDVDINSAVQEIVSRIQQKHDGGVVHENDPKEDFCVLSEKKQAKFERQLIGAAEVILREKLLVGQNKKLHYSEEFMDALEKLISHKLLFFKLLEDPDSELTRRVNYILNVEQGKTVIQKESEGKSNRKQRLFSRCRVRSQEAVMLTENEDAETPSYSDVLDTGSEALPATVTVNNPTPNSRTKSIFFSFAEIKRRLKHAMGKDRDGVAIATKNEIFKKVSHGNQVLRPSGEIVPGRMSPSRNPHLEAEIHPKRLSSPRKSEVESLSQQKMSNSFVESASKQSSPMQINDDDDSASDRVSLPISSHAMEPSCTSPIVEKWMSSPQKSMNSNEDSEGLKQDKNVNAGEDLSDQSSMVESSESDDTFSTKLESWNPCPIISEYKDFDVEDESQYSVEMNPQAEVTLERLKNSVDTSVVIDSVTITASDKQDEIEENCTASSQITLAPSCLGSDNAELVEDVASKIEKPSPTSVLEPLFLDNEISPPSSKFSQAGGLPVAQLQIHFDECSVPESDQSAFDQKLIDDNESKRSYIQQILMLSGFSWDAIYLKSLSSEQLLDESIYSTDADILSDQPCNDYKLLFDCLNEVLMDSCARYFGGCPLTTSSKHNIRPIPNIENALREIWQGVEWHLRPLSPPRSLEQMFEKHLAKDGRWIDLRFDAEIIGNQVEDIILQELLEDTALCCFCENTEILTPD